MRPLFLFIFFLSGAAALMYEVAWTRSMVLIVGNTNLAVGMVLAVFLLNFSLGSAAASKWGKRPDRLLARYAWIELCIGGCGIILPFLFSLLKPLYPGMAGLLDPKVVRFALCMLVLSVPTFLMGATLPLMNGIFITKKRGLSGQAGLIYAVQTVGAALGAALAGFVLLEQIGLRGTGLVAAAINGFIFLVIVVIVRVRGPCLEAPSGGDEPLSAPGEPDTPGQAALSYLDEVRSSVLLAAVFCNAFAALALEVLWTRILVFFLGSLAYSFTVMLVLYLLALGLGGCALALLDRFFEPRRIFGSILLFTGGASVCLCLLSIPVMYEVIEAVKGAPGSYGFGRFLASSFLGGSLLMLPGALLIGMFTPLAVGILVRDRGGVCRGAGTVYAVSNLGACLGAMAAAWLLVPAFGLKMGIMVAGFMVMVSALMLFLFSRASTLLKAGAFAFQILAVMLLVEYIRGGFIRKDDAFLTRSLVVDSHVFKRPGRESYLELKGYSEGSVCTASVVRDLAADEYRLYVDGFNAAATGSAYNYMRMMAHLPVMVCKEPRRALVIGYGTGTTAGSLSLHAGIEKLVIVELSRSVWDMANTHFSRWNRDVAQSDAVEAMVGMDGRDYLNLADDGFDIITLEPMMPYTPGAVHFYTSEFYALCRKKLNPGGALCHWIPLNALPGPEFRLLLNTFMTELPGSAFFLFEDAVLLLGFTEKNWCMELNRIEALFEDPVLKSDLERAGVSTPLMIAGAFVGDEEALKKTMGTEGVMSDDRTVIEYVPIASSRKAFKRMADNLAFLAGSSVSMASRLDLTGFAGEKKEELHQRIRRFELSSRLLMKGRKAETEALYEAYVTGSLDFSAPWKDLYERAFYMNQEDSRAAERYSHGLVREALSCMARRNFAGARELTNKAAAVAPMLWEVYMAECYLNLAAGNVEELQQAVDVLRQVKPLSNLTLAFRAELAALKGDEDTAGHLSGILEASGGLVGEMAELLERVIEARKAGDARYAVPSIDLALELLAAGPDELTKTGRSAWSVARGFDRDILDEARNEFLLCLDEEGDEVMKAVRGLGFFHDKEVQERLKEFYENAAGRMRWCVLESLARAGDTEVLIKVLEDGSSSTKTMIEATQVVCDLKIMDALGPLIDLLESADQTVRMAAFVALVHLTDVRFGYDPNASQAKRARSIDQWRHWYRLRK